MALESGTRLGPYEIVALVGAGGMGEVYRARDTRLDRTVAVKVLPPHLTASAAARERFQREAKAVAALQHPNICTVYDVGVADDQYFIVMELLDGETLQQRLTRGPVEMDQLVECGIALADALDVAHAHALIHRDIKPGNVFLTARGPKLLDFGLAKSVAAAAAVSIQPTMTAAALLTDPGSAVGTVAYMSPEQLQGEELDGRTDLFSLGLVLYEMATGQPAFKGRTTAMISAAILDSSPVPPSRVRPDLPAALEQVVLKMIEKERDVRCQSAAELRADLKRVRRDLDRSDRSGRSDGSDRSTIGVGTATASVAPPSVAAPSSDSQVLASLMKRHRGALALAAAGLLVLAAGMFMVLRRTAATAPAETGVSLDSFDVVQLTTTGNAELPATSPDGRYVAYVQRDSRGASLWIRQVASTSNVEIVAPEENRPIEGVTVTPDGSFVDFVRANSLWRVPFLGGTPRRVVDRIASSIDWSPDGQQFAFVRADLASGTDELVVAAPDGSSERVLAARRRPQRFNSVNLFGVQAARSAWSPDGRTIALYGDSGGQGGTGLEVVFVDAASGAERAIALPTSAGGPQALAWFDDTSLLMNHSGQSGAPTQLWRLSYPDGQVSRVTNDVNVYVGVSLSTDRTSLTTMRSDTRLGLWAMDVAGSSAAQITAPAPFVVSVLVRPTVAWNGDRIVYTANPGSGPLVMAVPAAGGSPETIGGGSEGAGGLDGRTMVYRSTEAGREGLWKVDADGRQPSRLVEGHVVGPRIVPDGRSVVFLSARSGAMSPWLVSIDGGELLRITDSFAGAGSLDVSPEGRAIVFMSQEGGLMVCELPMCASPRRAPAEPRGAFRRTPRWTPDGRSIAYVDATESNIWIQPLDGSAPRQLTHFADGRLISDFAFSHDGKRLAVARMEVRNDIVLFRGLR